MMTGLAAWQGLVGGKSRNLATLRGALPASIAVPVSVALPFGAFERALQHEGNAAAARDIAALQKKLVRRGRRALPVRRSMTPSDMTTTLCPVWGRHSAGTSCRTS